MVNLWLTYSYGKWWQTFGKRMVSNADLDIIVSEYQSKSKPKS